MTGNKSAEVSDFSAPPIDEPFKSRSTEDSPDFIADIMRLFEESSTSNKVSNGPVIDRMIGVGEPDGGIGPSEKSIYPADQPGCWGLDREECRIQMPKLAEIKQSAHKVRAGETLDSIVGKKLGGQAVPAQLETFKQAIREVNGIKDGAEPQKGQMLRIPAVSGSGHFVMYDSKSSRIWSPWDGSRQTSTADGTTTLNTRDGTTTMSIPGGDKITSYKDGSTVVVKQDGTHILSDKEGEHVTRNGITTIYDEKGHFKKLVQRLDNADQLERVPDGAGGFIDRYTGQRRENNFSLTETKDKVLEVKTAGSDRVLRFPDREAIRAERQNLLDKAIANIKEPGELTKFKADMIRFENRMVERGAPDKEIADTYRHIGRLLDKSAPGKIDHDRRVELAEQIISQAASPDSIDQGQHKTCNVTSIEIRNYTRRPSTAAKAVADVALNGDFDGPVMKIKSVDSLFRADDEASVNPPNQGARSFASQIYQITAINGVYQEEGGMLRFEQVKPNPSDMPGDTGERLLSNSTDEEFGQRNGNGLTSEQITRAYALMTGDADKKFVLEFDPRSAGQDASEPTGRALFRTQQEFSDILARARREGTLPLILTVHSGNEPFLTDSGHGTAGGSGGWHAVSITDYDENSGRVSVDNQWGAVNDHIEKPLALNELFYGTMEPLQAKIRKLQDEVGGEKAGVQDLDRDLKVLEMLDVGASQFTDRLLLQYGNHWMKQTQEGTFDRSEQARVLDVFDKAMDKLKLEDKMQLLFLSKFSVDVPADKFGDMFAKVAPELGISREKIIEFLSQSPAEQKNFSRAGNMAHKLALVIMQRTHDKNERNRLVKSFPLADETIHIESPFAPVMSR